ncbi:MAG: hypothetical protein ACTSR8_20460 [Promethearchaeota archaeon]
MKEDTLLRVSGILVCIIGIILILVGGIKTPENFRILSDIIQTFFLFMLIILLFLPDNRLMKIAFIIGIFTVITDFLLETIAVYLDWWYPLGGTQFPPVIIVPLEMIFSFLFIGAAMAIMLTFPEKIREMNFPLFNWIKPLFQNEKNDWYWRIFLIFLNALIGTNGDYSAGDTIWAPGPYWQPFYTFLVWLFGGLFTLLQFYLLDKRIKE